MEESKGEREVMFADTMLVNIGLGLRLAPKVIIIIIIIIIIQLLQSYFYG